MENRTPNIDAGILESVTIRTLAEHFRDIDDSDIYDILTPLNKAGVFEELEEHIRSEHLNPSVKH